MSSPNGIAKAHERRRHRHATTRSQDRTQHKLNAVRRRLAGYRDPVLLFETATDVLIEQGATGQVTSHQPGRQLVANHPSRLDSTARPPTCLDQTSGSTSNKVVLNTAAAEASPCLEVLSPSRVGRWLFESGAPGPGWSGRCQAGALPGGGTDAVGFDPTRRSGAHDYGDIYNPGLANLPLGRGMPLERTVGGTLRLDWRGTYGALTRAVGRS